MQTTAAIRRLIGVGIATTGGAAVNVHRTSVLNEHPAEAPRALQIRHPLLEQDNLYEFVESKVSMDDRASPVTESEMTMSIEIIKERPDVLNDFLPFNAAANPSLAHRYVNRIVQDNDLMACVAAKVKAESERITATSKLGPIHSDLAVSLQWEQLRSLYGCVLCQDVLAMPNIVDCSHSFCGICLDELRSRCEPCDTTPKKDVIVDCPTCRAEITHSSFERILDEMIVNCVNKIPDCAMKTDWLQRRSDYQKVLDAAKPEVNKSRPTATERRRAPSHSAAHVAGDAEEYDFEGDWESFARYIVPALAFAAMVIIGVIRAHK